MSAGAWWALAAVLIAASVTWDAYWTRRCARHMEEIARSLRDEETRK